MTTTDPLALLRRVREQPTRPVISPEEHCELCSEVIASTHGHLVDLSARSLLCACRGCWLLFAPNGAGGDRYRAVPERYVTLGTGALSPEQWDALQIPVSVAFFFRHSGIDEIAAFYPGPAGATESLLSLEAFEDAERAMPALSTMAPDVEALLVRSPARGEGAECFIVPIDACYELVGRLRLLWRGFDGGSEANAALSAFFDEVRAKARPAPTESSP